MLKGLLGGIGGLVLVILLGAVCLGALVPTTVYQTVARNEAEKRAETAEERTAATLENLQAARETLEATEGKLAVTVAEREAAVEALESATQELGKLAAENGQLQREVEFYKAELTPYRLTQEAHRLQAEEDTCRIVMGCFVGLVSLLAALVGWLLYKNFKVAPPFRAK